MTKPLSDRFWAKVPLPDSADGCMEWAGARDVKGYGRIRVGDGRAIEMRAHRLAWQLANGVIAEGMAVCHVCDNPPCVRPDHLFVGTFGDNNRDASVKGRTARGADHGNAVLTDDLVREIRRLRGEGKSYTAIADATGVNRATAFAAVKRNWAWLDAEAA